MATVSQPESLLTRLAEIDPPVAQPPSTKMQNSTPPVQEPAKPSPTEAAVVKTSQYDKVISAGSIPRYKPFTETFKKITIPSSCNSLRHMISDFLATKEMTKIAFCKALGICTGTLGRFMKLKGARNGNNAYYAAREFFKARVAAQETAHRAAQHQAAQHAAQQQAAQKTAQLQAAHQQPQPAQQQVVAQQAQQAVQDASEVGKKRTHADMSATAADDLPAALFNSSIALPPPAAARMTSASSAAIIAEASAVHLADDRVLEDCDEVRRKASILLSHCKMPKKTFADAIGCSVKALNAFMTKKGANEGADSVAFPKVYRFFERLRIARESNTRVEPRAAAPAG